MNTLGKIFVFAVMIMSVVFMSFAIAIFSSHTNWQKESKRLATELEQSQAERQAKESELTKLKEQIVASGKDREQVVAKLETALQQKDGELADLKNKRDAEISDLDKDIKELAEAKDERDAAEKLVGELREEIHGLQENLKGSVNRGAELAAELHQAESDLAMATERKTQLEQQVSNARVILQQNGLSLKRPRTVIPVVGGVVTAVADDLVEVSIGSDDGLQAGHELEVFRADEYLGRLRVVSVKPDRAVVRVLKDFARGIVQRGDRVATRLKLDS
jgi:DNA repair exonuclease SbcCD ATPase subunit